MKNKYLLFKELPPDTELPVGSLVRLRTGRLEIMRFEITADHAECMRREGASFWELVSVYNPPVEFVHSAIKV